MNERKNWGMRVGLVLHLLIGGMLIFTGAQKVLGFVPPEALARLGLSEQMRLIGAGAVITGLLLLIPRTASLGVLLASSFWGGTICIHMAHGDPYVLQTVFLVVSWVGAYLRHPAPFGHFPRRRGPTRSGSTAGEPAGSAPRSGYGGPVPV
jgi:hypothetical protein